MRQLSAAAFEKVRKALEDYVEWSSSTCSRRSLPEGIDAQLLSAAIALQPSTQMPEEGEDRFPYPGGPGKMGL